MQTVSKTYFGGSAAAAAAAAASAGGTGSIGLGLLGIGAAYGISKIQNAHRQKPQTYSPYPSMPSPCGYSPAYQAYQLQQPPRADIYARRLPSLKFGMDGDSGVTLDPANAVFGWAVSKLGDGVTAGKERYERLEIYKSPPALIAAGKDFLKRAKSTDA